MVAIGIFLGTVLTQQSAGKRAATADGRSGQPRSAGTSGFGPSAAS